MKEVELGEDFCKYLEEQGYEVFQEVTLGYAKKTIDIIAKINNIIIGFELKTTLNLEVLAQAEQNKQWCHYSYIVVPCEKGYGNSSKGRLFAQKICRDYGIGLYYIDYRSNLHIYEKIHAKFNRKISKLQLHELQKTFAKAGNNEGKKFTVFQSTILEIYNYVKLFGNYQQLSFKDVIKKISHHYASDSTAVNCIRKYINTGIIKCLKLNRGILSINPEYKNGEDLYDKNIIH